MAADAMVGICKVWVRDRMQMTRRVLAQTLAREFGWP
jgi:hypothetical protein